MQASQVKIFAVFILLFSCTKTINASSSLTLSVDQAVDQAIKGNITIKQKDISLSAANRTKNYSWYQMSPSISANASIQKKLPEPEKTAGGVGANTSNAANISIGASINIGLSPSIFTTINGAALSYEKELIDYNTAVRTIELNVRKAFYSILYEKENVSLREQNADTAKKQYNSNLTKYNRGLLPRLDVLNSQIAYQNAKLNLDNAKTTLNNDLATFKQLLGLPQDTQIDLTGTLQDVLSIPQIASEDIQQNSTSIASLQKQIEIAQNNLLASRFSAYAPSISAGYSYNMGKTLESSSKWSNGGTLSLGISIPLDGFLPWSKGSQSVASQKDNIKNLQLQLEDAKTTLEVNTQSYLNKIKQLQSAIELQQSSVNFARQSYSMTKEAYSSGTKDLLALQTSSDNLLQAEVNLKSQLYSLIATILELENTLGIPFGTLGKK